jgi:hypothetical protein
MFQLVGIRGRADSGPNRALESGVKRVDAISTSDQNDSGCTLLGIKQSGSSQKLAQVKPSQLNSSRFASVRTGRISRYN